MGDTNLLLVLLVVLVGEETSANGSGSGEQTTSDLECLIS